MLRELKPQKSFKTFFMGLYIWQSAFGAISAQFSAKYATFSTFFELIILLVHNIGFKLNLD